MKLRDYQEECIEKVRAAYMRKLRAVLVVMATGLGKTIVFSELARLVGEKGRRTMVSAHRKELIHQAADKLTKVTGMVPDIEMAALEADEDGYFRASCVVSSIQTLGSNKFGEGKRLHRFDASKFGLYVVDEAHHAVSRSYIESIDHFRKGGAFVLGVTATPRRADEVRLGDVFEECVYEYGIVDGVRGGWLVEPIPTPVFVEGLDLSDCKTSGYDLSARDLSRIIEEEDPVHRMVWPTIEIAKDRRTLVFCVSVRQATMAAQIFNRHRTDSAAVVSAKTPAQTRAEIFKAYANGEIQFLCNVGIATEGWDDPAEDGKGVQVISMMRPTKSLAFYTQCVGRGTRPLPGLVDPIGDADGRREAIQRSPKPMLEIVDFHCNSGRHKLVNCVDALGGSVGIDERVVRIARRMVEEKGGGHSVLDLIEQAKRQLEADEEENKRRGLRVKALFRTGKIDPFDVEDVVNQPSTPWERKKPATRNQISFLVRRGVDVDVAESLNIGQASRMIDRLMSSCSPKQAAVLRRAGIDPSGVSFKQASKVITWMKDNAWSAPPPDILDTMMNRSSIA